MKLVKKLRTMNELLINIFLCIHNKKLALKMLRYTNALQHVNKADVKPDESTRDDGKEYHLLNDDIYQKHMVFTKMYEEDKFIQENYRKLRIILHPFEIIQTTIIPRLIRSGEKIKITNAFMKMYEFLVYIYPYIEKHITDGKLTMYDVAGAPGMFVLAADYFFRKRNIELDWHACSLMNTEENHALEDTYKLFHDNPDRFTPCDVTNENDIKNCLKGNRKYFLVTGDIGAWYESYDILQEFQQLDLEWGQMVLALNLCAEHGVMFLKMYTTITTETAYLMDTLTLFFKEVYITKPRTSRILNNESYIICVDRNKESCKDIPLKRPSVGNYQSKNRDVLLTFENAREDYKLQIATAVIDVLKNKDNHIRMNELIKVSPVYAEFYKTIEKIYNILVNRIRDNAFVKAYQYVVK